MALLVVEDLSVSFKGEDRTVALAVRYLRETLSAVLGGRPS